jgi:DNA-binding NarL/FixJ family response regulator
MRRAARERPPVLVVDDDAAFREHVRIVLEDAGFGVLESGTAEDALRIARDAQPPLAVLDVHLPGMSGYEVCRALREELGQRIGIIFLSGSKVETIDRAAGLTLGADDYILKPFEPEELVARVRALLRRVAPEADASTSFAGSTEFDLTPRELEVLRLLADGLDQDEIAQRLFITPKTVATHIERILGKLGVRSRAQAVALAYREELVNTG